VIIFGSVWFLPKKITKLFKKPKPNRNRFTLTDFRSVILEQKPKPNRLVSVLFWFGYFILKTKNYIVFRGFFCSFYWVWFRFGSVINFGSVWFFGFRLIKPKPNWLVFLTILIGSIDFFLLFGFFGYLFFWFSRFNRFFDVFTL
jgi:hypothetical protein